MAAKRRAEQILEATVPPAIHWTTNQVANWIADFGFPQYQECITNNFISGRRLILLDASTLPKIGITDFEHIKTVAAAIRALLEIEEPDYTRSIYLPRLDSLGTYLEQKSRSGRRSDGLTYVSFLTTNRNVFVTPGSP